MISGESEAGYLKVEAQLTPNPQSARYEVDRVLLSGEGADFAAPEAAENAPLAKRLFEIDGVERVFVGRDFVTTTVREGLGPLTISPFVEDALRAHVESGEPAVVRDGEDPHVVKAKTEIEQQIITTLDQKVRPAVASDGGDVVFAGFEDGVVQLEMRGACSGCPSSLMTLKIGIENLLREEFPDHVVAVEPV